MRKIREYILKSPLYQGIEVFYEKVEGLIARIYRNQYAALFSTYLEKGREYCDGLGSRIHYLVLFLYSIFYTVLADPLIHFQSHTYDYVFHLTRMVGLAESIQHWDLLPNLNFMYAYGTGYASPMFYGNWQFYPSALLYVLTQDAILAYSLFAFLLVFFSAAASYLCISKISQNKSIALLVALTIPSFYSLFGFGMTMVMPLVPLLIYSIYRVLFLNKKNPLYLAIVIALLLQTHLLSTLVLAIYSLVFVLLNVNKISKEKLLSFGFSVLVAVFLSAGFILQYLEQTASQKFFFSWLGRSYPADINATFSPPFPFQLDSYGLYKPFTSLEWPIHKLVLYGFMAFSLFLPIFYQKLSAWSKTFYWTIWLVYFSSTSILPWKTVLKFTFLGSLQYTGRLLFFIPLLFIFLLALTDKKGYLSLLMCLASLVFFYGRLLPRYSSPSDNYQHLLAYKEEHSQRLLSVYKGDKSQLFSPIGDEYYNLEIRNEDVRDPQFAAFSASEGVEISNIKSAYNKLDFDVSFTGPTAGGSLVLPRIWYKGYQVTYSQGAAGGPARMVGISYTEEEKVANRELKKPQVANKVLHNGKMTLNLSQPGHVSITYRKTFLQHLGFLIEFLSWSMAAYLLWLIFQKKSRRR